MVIDLPPYLEKALVEFASQQGSTPEKLATAILLKELMPLSRDPRNDPQNFATMGDFLKGYAGVLKSGEIAAGGARMSENAGKKFAEGLLKKHQRQSP